MSRPLQFALPLAVLAVVSAIAYAAGAANLGTALTFGQLAFALTLVAVLLRAS